MTLTFSSEKYGNLLAEYQPKVIRTEEENERALAAVPSELRSALIEELMHRRDRSSEENELYDLLITLVEKFEQEFYQPGSRSTAQSMLQLLIEQQGTAIADLSSILGSEVLVAKTLKGEHEMTIAQIKAFGQLFNVDSSVFL